MQKGSIVLQKKVVGSCFIEDVYWKGVCYMDKCKAEKDLKESLEKDKIKSEIQ